MRRVACKIGEVGAYRRVQQPECVGRCGSLLSSCVFRSVLLSHGGIGRRFNHNEAVGQAHFPLIHRLPMGSTPLPTCYVDLEAELLLDSDEEATIVRLRGAADLPERVMVEKIRPVWKLVLGEDATFGGLDALHEALDCEGSAGAIVKAQLPGAMARYPISKESLQAAATLRVFDPTPWPIRSAFKVMRYSGIDEAKGEVKRLASEHKLSAEHTTRLLDAVDVWFPVYQWADNEVMTNGWE